MKHIPNEVTSITEEKVKFKGDPGKLANYSDLITVALDTIPQGGYTPKDIRERNRIQEALDKAGSGTINLEDSDYDALEKIMKESRWVIREKDLQKLLGGFEDGTFKNSNEKETKKTK